MNNIRRRMLFITLMLTICVTSFCANWYVSKDGADTNNGSSWDQSFLTITKSLSDVADDDHIWVATGIYQEGMSITVPENIFLYGGFSGNEASLSERIPEKNRSIIDGMNVYRCVKNQGTIDGFSITNGNFYNGAGIYNYGTVSSCRVHKNNSTNYGGGIYNYSGTISSCQIYDNTTYNHGGGIYNYYGTVTGCEIFCNEATINYNSAGGGVYSQFGNILFCNVYDNIAKNEGGGIYMYGGSSDTSLVHNNSAIRENGGGIYCAAGEILNCTIVANNTGGGVYFTNSNGKMANSIIWGNEEMDINNDANVFYCCYREADGTNGNISAEPLFIHTEGGADTWDLHLKENSPCIDSGTTSENGSDTDLDGILRPLGNGMDMGAYEYGSSLRAVFFADKRQGLKENVFIFTDASYGDQDSWAWDFNDDGIVDSNEQNPTHVYSESGFHSVSLTVSKNGVSHTTTKTNYIYISTILHVRPDGDDANNGLDWDGAFQSITQAIHSAWDNDCIWVADGLYREGHTITVPEKISLYGGFSGNELQLSERSLKTNRSIIDGMNAYGCIYNYGTVDGFCITNGNANQGAGIYNDQGIVVSSEVYENLALSAGGGIFNNTGTVLSCKVHDNNALHTGGGIYNSEGSVSFCTVYANISIVYGGGGIYNERGLYLENGRLDSNLIFDNFANTNGGGVYCRSGKIINCTIIGNNAGMGGSGVYLFSDAEEMSNSIIWENESDDVYKSEVNSISFCCYREADGANGNISTDPLLVNTDGESNTWDLHLKESSLCIDSGGSNGSGADIDMDGIVRPQCNGMDMGAYEYSDSLRAIFYCDVAIGRPGDTFSFTDASVGNPDSWQWDFDGDGEIDSTEQHPSYVYSETGLYTVSLTITINGDSHTVSKINYIGIYDERIFYVKPDGNNLNDGLSWEHGFKTIYRAVQISEPFDQIWVAAGTYQEGATVIVPDHVSVYGGFSGNESLLSERNAELNRSIIDGKSSFQCVFNKGLLDGFSITNGYAYFGAGIYNDRGTVSFCRVYSNAAHKTGAGIYNSLGTVFSCRIYENYSLESAGGILNRNGFVSDCRIYENISDDGGGIVNHLGNVSDCEIYLNTAFLEGGGIVNDYGTLVSCTINKNSASSGGGIYNYYGAIAGCEIYKNKAEYRGGGIYNYDGTLDTNVIFDNRSANEGGGVFCVYGSLIQCTIVGNSAGDDGSGVYLLNSSNILNSIVWANEANDVQGTQHCAYSCFRESEGANGNISADPQFAYTEGDVSAWDFHLLSGSPCIDSGSIRENETVIDMDGITRPQGNGMDMGAYESSDSLRALFFADKRNGLIVEEFVFTDISYGNPDAWAWDFDSDGVVDSTEQNPTYSFSESGFYSVTLTVSENGMTDSIIKTNHIYITTVLYVSPAGDDEADGLSWEKSFQSIDRALFEAFAYDHIWVAAGTYQEGDTITVPENISLYGGFSGNELDFTQRNIEENLSVIDGENSYRCVNNSGTVNGVTIRNGNSSTGAGVYNNEGTISFCKIQENTAYDIGGGIYNVSGTISHCKVFENSASIFGGGISNAKGDIDTSVVFDNSSDLYGCGVYSDAGNIHNCTIVGNLTDECDNGVYIKNGVNMVNSIIWNNKLDRNNNDNRIYNNCYPGAIASLGNISADPMLVNIEGDSSNWDFHLMEGSPCIDSGKAIENGSEIDMDGILRPQSYALDMGAYEVTTYLRVMFFCNKKNGFPGDTFTFTDTSYGNPDSWQWDFDGDGVVDSTEQNPSYRYSESGYYSVTLTVTKDGETDTISKTNEIHIGDVFYVKTDGDISNNGQTWHTAWQSIHQAIENSYSHDQIWVAAGTYLEGSTITVPENVILLGGFSGDEMAASERDVASNPSVIDGNDSYRCICIDNGTIDGFSITNGSSSSGAGVLNLLGTMISCKVYENTATYNGGGIVNRQGTVAYCQVYMNTAENEGGGVYNDYGILNSCQIDENRSDDGGGTYNYYGAVTSCSLSENTSVYGGGLYNYGGEISSCKAEKNTAQAGGGIYNEYGTVFSCEVNENTAEDNGYGGGIFNREGVISLCEVAGNFAHKNGGGISNAYGTLDTNAVYDNLADTYGGGIFSSAGEIISCSIIGNNGFNEGRGVYLEGNDTKMTNSIIWDNNIDDVYNQDGEISYCCYREADNTDGNISVDPQLTNTEGETDIWDLHLMPNSPCIDSGISLDIGSDTDMDDVTRPQGNGMDMGAFEFLLKTAVNEKVWNIYQ